MVKRDTKMHSNLNNGRDGCGMFPPILELRRDYDARRKWKIEGSE